MTVTTRSFDDREHNPIAGVASVVLVAVAAGIETWFLADFAAASDPGATAKFPFVIAFFLAMLGGLIEVIHGD